MAGLDRQEQTRTANHDQAPPAQVEDAGHAGGTTQFTNAGSIPPVSTAAPQAAGPSASDRAFGAHESGGSSHAFTGPAHLRVKVDGLNVRSSPDKSDNIVGGVNTGDQLEADGRDGDWVSVSFKGQRAFVYGKYVEAIPAKVAPEVAANPEKVVETAKEVEKPAQTEAAKPAPAAAPDTAVTPAAPSPVPMPYPNVAHTEAPHASAAAAHVEAPKPAAHADAPKPAAHAEAAKPAAHADAAKPAAHAEAAHASAEVVRAEYELYVTMALSGFLSTSVAVEQFIQFDREHNGGQMSVTGLELLPTMPFDIAGIHAAQQAPAAHPAPAAQPAPAAHDTPPPTYAGVAPMHGKGEFAVLDPKAETFETIQHTRVQVDSDAEGKVLQAIRANHHQFDPVWLLAAQTKLGVADATGAFNTETLRAMGKGKLLTAKQILDKTFLATIHEGEPFVAEVDEKGHEEPDHTKTMPADIAAQAIGYADYHSYQSKHLHPTKFLGVSLKQGISSGRAHPHLQARLATAESYLIQRFGSQEKAIQGIGWSGKAGAAYADTDASAYDEADPKSHMHTMGLAIDIDPNRNPYTMPKGDGASADWIDWFYTAGFEMGHRLGFGGDALTASGMWDQSMKMSSEELHDHMLKSSHAFARVVEMSEQSDEDIKAALLAAGYKDDSSKQGVSYLLKEWFGSAKKIFHDKKSGERKFHETMTESKELVVALRDAAGLSWGGTEMSTVQNGDFMHFDCRKDDIGKTVFDVAYAAHNRYKADHKKKQ